MPYPYNVVAAIEQPARKLCELRGINPYEQNFGPNGLYRSNWEYAADDIIDQLNIQRLLSDFGIPSL